tara:strand:+ start:93 stop:722 length:630 start_codon:yes stop_codon:yes gene_type:complete
MEDGKQFNINIFKDHKDGIESVSNKSETYILIANEKLNNTNRELINELKDVQAQNETLTDDNERMEVTVTNQRGMLHNLHGVNVLEKESSQLSSELSKNCKNEVSDLVKFHKNIMETFKMALVYFMGFLLIQCSMGLIDLVTLTTIVTSVVGIGYITLRIHSNEFNIESVSRKYSSPRAELESQLKDIQEKIETTQSSTDHISNFIDAL